MALIEWKPSYSVGVGLFDYQHQKLFALINQLHEAMSKGRAKEHLASVVASLAAYTATHFAEEESALERAGYKDLDAHKAMHRQFEAKVAQFGAEVKQGTLGVSIQVMDFLNNWLTDHILKVDKGYTSVLVQQPTTTVR